MKHTYRILCLLLILSMLTLALVSCSTEDTPATSNSKAPGEETSDAGFRLEKQNFGGVTIKFLTDKANDYISWEVAPQEMVEGDRVNNAFYDRARLIEEQYGIILEQVYAENQNEVIKQAQKNIEAGIDEYQVYVAGLLYLSNLVGDESLLDLSGIESNNYLDFTQPYWDQSIIRDLTVLDSVYFATGDALVTDDEATWAIFFNKDIANDYHITDPYEVSSIYDLVKQGKWTIDVLYEMEKAVITDNGDYGMAWGPDTPDLWGMLSQCYDSYTFTVGCGETLMQNDGTNITVTAGRQSCVNAFDKIFNMLTDSDTVANADLQGSKEAWSTEHIEMFSAGKGLFMPNRIATVSNSILRNANIHYGLLPMPKINEQQVDYTTTVTVYWCSAFAVPVTNSEKLDATCYALEAMAYHGMEKVTPEYYEHTLKDKRFEDSESLEMLDLIFRNRTYDMGAAFNLGGALGFFTNLLITGRNGGTNNHISSLESVQSSWELAIEDYIAQIEDARK